MKACCKPTEPNNERNNNQRDKKKNSIYSLNICIIFVFEQYELQNMDHPHAQTHTHWNQMYRSIVIFMQCFSFWRVLQSPQFFLYIHFRLCSRGLSTFACTFFTLCPFCPSLSFSLSLSCFHSIRSYYAKQRNHFLPMYACARFVHFIWNSLEKNAICVCV